MQFRRLQHQVADAGPMHFDAEEIPLRVRRGECDQRFAVAEPDLERACRVAAEDRRQVKRTFHGFEAESWPELLPGAILGDGHASGAHDEAADRPMAQVFVWRHALQRTRVPDLGDSTERIIRRQDAPGSNRWLIPQVSSGTWAQTRRPW